MDQGCGFLKTRVVQILAGAGAVSLLQGSSPDSYQG